MNVYYKLSELEYKLDEIAGRVRGSVEKHYLSSLSKGVRAVGNSARIYRERVVEKWVQSFPLSLR